MKATMKKITALVITFLFAVSFSAFSQNTKDAKVKDEDGKMHIKIEIEKDGKTTKVDTIINPEDLAALNERLHDLDVQIGSPDDFPMLHAFKFDWDEKKWEEHMKELEKQLENKEIDMKEFEKHMEALEEKTKAQHNMFKYKIKTDADSDMQLLELEKQLEHLDNFNFNFNHDGKKKTIVIEGDDININGKDVEMDGKDVKIKSDDGEKEIIIKRKSKPGEKDGKHNKETKKVIIIMKSSGLPEKQKAEFAAEPVNEQETPDGENAGRVRFVEKNKNANNSWLDDLTLYPNPSTGEFTLSFRLNHPEQAELKIMDIAGREIFAENIPENAEWVEKQIKLPTNSSATYLLILRQGNNWHHEKIFVRS